MADTSTIFARIDTGLKENAEHILSQLISPSSAIQMLYSQIVLTRGLPFDLRLPSAKPTAIEGMSRAGERLFRPIQRRLPPPFQGGSFHLRLSNSGI